MEKDITYQKSEPYLTFLFVILTKNYNLYSKQFFHHITLYKKQITEKNNQVLGVCKRTYRRVSVQTEKETLPPFPIVSRELEQKRKREKLDIPLFPMTKKELKHMREKVVLFISPTESAELEEMFKETINQRFFFILFSKKFNGTQKWLQVKHYFNRKRFYFFENIKPKMKRCEQGILVEYSYGGVFSKSVAIKIMHPKGVDTFEESYSNAIEFLFDTEGTILSCIRTIDRFSLHGKVFYGKVAIAEEKSLLYKEKVFFSSRMHAINPNEDRDEEVHINGLLDYLQFTQKIE